MASSRSATAPAVHRRVVDADGKPDRGPHDGLSVDGEDSVSHAARAEDAPRIEEKRGDDVDRRHAAHLERPDELSTEEEIAVHQPQEEAAEEPERDDPHELSHVREVDLLLDARLGDQLGDARDERAEGRAVDPREHDDRGEGGLARHREADVDLRGCQTPVAGDHLVQLGIARERERGGAHDEVREGRAELGVLEDLERRAGVRHVDEPENEPTGDGEGRERVGEPSLAERERFDLVGRRAGAGGVRTHPFSIR